MTQNVLVFMEVARGSSGGCYRIDTR